MLSVFSFLSQNTGDAPIYLDGFHPIDVVLSMILLLRNLCTSDTENKTCPEVYAGISWNNLFKLSVKVAQHYKLDKPEDDGIAFFFIGFHSKHSIYCQRSIRKLVSKRGI